jgi:hypothetical protein
MRPINDRQNMAKMARDAVDVRCLGTLGGLIGAFLGFVALAYVGSLLGGAGVLIAILGIPLGWWLGVRTALGWLANRT